MWPLSYNNYLFVESISFSWSLTNVSIEKHTYTFPLIFKDMSLAIQLDVQTSIHLWTGKLTSKAMVIETLSGLTQNLEWPTSRLKEM